MTSTDYELDLKEIGMSGTIRLFFRNKHFRDVWIWEKLARVFNHNV